MEGVLGDGGQTGEEGSGELGCFFHVVGHPVADGEYVMLVSSHRREVGV